MTRSITTAAELDALPFPSAVAFPGYGDWYKIRDGRWLCDDGDILTSGELALVANGDLAMTGDPSAPVPVVSDAAVEAAAIALIGSPSVDYDYWRQRAREALTAALPFLAAQPVPEASREDDAADALAAYVTDTLGLTLHPWQRRVLRAVITPRTDR